MSTWRRAGERRLRRVRAGWRFLRNAWGRVDFELARRFGLATREDRVFFLLIPLSGLLAGLLGVAVASLIEVVRKVFWGRGASVLEVAQGAPPWLVIGAPALGGLLVGLVVWLGRQPVSGGGMSVLIESVLLRQGSIPARPVIANALGAILTVGSGGSLGKEGPMIRVGAMISSRLGERLGISGHRLKILVGCGAAAGLAAAYNIPVGGALFAMEVILGNFALEIFGPIVVASVISTLVARGFRGDVPVYPAPEYSLASAWELLPYLGLGVVGAISSVLLVQAVRGARGAFARLTFLPKPVLPMLGLGLVGVLGLWFPHILGSGFETIGLAVHGELEVTWLLLLPAAKIAAVALTSGSGGAGGMFTPSLFVGATVGGAYGVAVNALWPELAPEYAPFAAVGMAAITAGASHAPISSILILFELSGNYDLILPLMIASITASVLSKAISPHSIYEAPLVKKGLDPRWRMEEAVLAGIDVGGLTREEAVVLRPSDSYADVVEKFLSTHRQRLFVVDEDRRLLGAVSLHDIKYALGDPTGLPAVLAHDLTTPVDRVLAPTTRLHQAVEVFAQSEYERLPVVDPDSGRLAGVLAKRDLLAIYSQEVLGRPAMLATFVSRQAGRDYVELPPDFAVRMVPVPGSLVGHTLAQAALPQRAQVRVLEVKRRRDRADERVVPEAATVLGRDDQLVVMGPREALDRLARGVVGEDEAAAHAAID